MAKKATKTKKTAKEKTRHELEVYSLVGPETEALNLYAWGGPRPNARFIARQYGCDIEFPKITYSDGPSHYWFGNRESVLDKNGKGLSMVVVGENFEQVEKAQRAIQNKYPPKQLKVGSVSYN